MRRENWKHIFVIWRVKITFPPPADQFQVWTSDALSSHLTLTSELQLFRQFESKEVCIKNSYPPEIRVRICLLCVLLKLKTYKNWISIKYNCLHMSHIGPKYFNDCCKKNGKCLASYFIHHDGSSVAHIAVNCSTHTMIKTKFPSSYIQNFIPCHIKHTPPMLLGLAFWSWEPHLTFLIICWQQWLSRAGPLFRSWFG